MSRLLDNAKVNLSAAQLNNARIIEEEFAAAGYSEKTIIAAIVNAYAESHLDAAARGDGGKSIGLFQLADFGAGKGMSVGERMDPRINTRRIIAEVKQYGSRVVSATTPREAAAYFSMDVERPADKEGAAQARRELTDKLFPLLSTVQYAAAFGLGSVLLLAAAGVAGYIIRQKRRR